MSIEAIKALRTAQNNLAPSRAAAITYNDGELWDEYEHAIQALEQAQKQDQTSCYCPNCEALSKQLEQAQKDPLKTPLPCDVKVGHVTMRKGVALRTLVARMQVLYDMTQAPQRQPLTPERVFSIADQHPVEGFDPDIMAFARAIEVAHGIK